MYIECSVKRTPKCQPKLKGNIKNLVICFILLYFQLMENGVLGHHGVYAHNRVGKES